MLQVKVFIFEAIKGMNLQKKMLNYIFQSTKIKKGVVSTSEKFIVCVG